MRNLRFLLPVFSAALLILALVARWMSLEASNHQDSALEITPMIVVVPAGETTFHQVITVRNQAKIPVQLTGGRFGCTKHGCVLCETELPVDIPPSGSVEFKLSIRLPRTTASDFTFDLYTSDPVKMVLPIRIQTETR